MFKPNSIGRLLSICLFLPIASLVIGATMISPSQAAGAVVNVSLWDKGAEMAMATDLGFPAAGKDMSKATMGIAVSVDTVKAGEITFEVLNSSKDRIHEVIITRLRDLTVLFPYNSCCVGESSAWRSSPRACAGATSTRQSNSLRVFASFNGRIDCAHG